ncbi:hypothetical protein XENOCAPTIV_015187 [Xenoophorus captivus]|uniref:Uncharacterized protein n=1 Tax=Xenoophorus captivus TaxID=1517983 RepID=A0ABV0RZP0_9TELE
MFLDCGRKPKYTETTHTCTGTTSQVLVKTTCKLHAERLQARSRTQDILPARQQCYQLYKKFNIVSIQFIYIAPNINTSSQLQFTNASGDKELNFLRLVQLSVESKFKSIWQS